MKVFKSNSIFFALLVVICLSSFCCVSLNKNLDNDNLTTNSIIDSSIPDWVLNDWATRTSETGIWIADNSAYKNEEEKYDAYAIQWNYGVGKNHLKGRLYFIIKGEDVGTVWEFTEYWDPIDNELKIIQIGSDGTIGQGKIWKTEDDKTKELQNFISPDGTKYSSGHISWMDNGVNHIESFRVNNGEWTKMRHYKWELKKEEQVKIPKEYDQISYLIGTWELPLGENKARMTFSWGKNKRTILYKNEYKPAKLNKWIQENEGLITYNAKKGALVFITSYSDLGSPLMATGEFKFSNDGTIYREFSCHYEGNVGLPWSNGAKAPKEGISLDFKQIWTPVDSNNFKGEFFWKKNGKWEHPIKSDSNIEAWTKVSNQNTNN